MIFSTVYTSASREPRGSDDLVSLLDLSRRRNAEAGITGLLLYRDDAFMQVLEGPHDAVESVFAAIEADERHTDVRLLLDEEIPARQFPAWSMGFRTVDDATLRQLRGYDDFLDRPASAAARPDAPSRARWLLEWFRTHPA